MPSLMDCSGPILKCWIGDCPFSTITQKGLTIHLLQMHNLRYRDKGRPTKTAKSRRKNAPARETDAWLRPYVCNLCNCGCTTKEELSRHHQQVHGGGAIYPPPHYNCMMANGAPGNPGTSRARQPHQRPEQSAYFYRWGPQHNQVVRYHHERPTYEPYYAVNQGPMRAEDFHAQPPAMQLQEPVAQVNQLDRSQMYEAQRSPSEWQNYRPSMQTPQAVSADLDSNMLARTDETANVWNPQMTSQRGEDGSAQLWSNVDHMQSLQYETTNKEVLNLAEAVNNDVQPCTQCGCASSGGCTQKALVPDDVNRIILVEEEVGGASNGGEGHQIVYHLQAGASFGNLKASNVKQVVSQGDEIVIEYRTEDGGEGFVRGVRAEAGAEEAIERPEGNHGLEMAMASSAIDTAEMNAENVGLEESNFTETPSLPESEPEAAEPNMQPAEESLHSTLPQLFPELFEGNPVSSENDSINWQTEGIEETDNFFEVCKKSEYLAALSHCRGVKGDSGALLLKCGQCPFCADMDNPLEQLQIHVRQHLETSFQCRNCEFASSLREEMVVHVGTKHDVPSNEPSY